MSNNDFSLIVTTHNKDWLTARVIQGIAKHTTGVYELIMVLDGCTDNTEATTYKTLEECKEKLTKYKVIYTPDVYETKADNAGFRVSEGKYCIHLDDDMIVNESGWNERLLKPVQVFPDVLAVTANTAHDLTYHKGSRHENMIEDLDYCWCDILDYTNIANKKSGLPRDVFAVRDTANRGPVLYVHEKLQQLSYFDEIFAPQNMDDHDLSCRAYKQHGWVSGVYWIDYINPPEWSSTRTDDPFLTPQWLYKAHHKNTKIVWNRHKDLILGNHHNENRKLP
jgi:glycosyltransferase involved in cell wall biosynthesis